MNCSDSPADQCIKGATCNNAKCECGANHTANADMTMCLMIIGETCVTKTDCVEGETDRVVCDADKKCACAATYAANDMMNMCKLKLNETCSADEDCGMNAMCSTGTSRKCACKVNFTPTGNTCESGSAAVVASLLLLVAALVTSRLM
ncbi:prion-like-(Q/N-rich) domain-bearing protein 25 [Littorina saxatilis]|uniref:prion-like-(Q/N-rich) domain-bearing protein 25 n=1 Tax=Littorina saxatilis TaxID=31220 RepID=UPI0038B5DB01